MIRSIHLLLTFLALFAGNANLFAAAGRITADPSHPSLNLAHAPSKITYGFDVFGRPVSSAVWHGGHILHEPGFRSRIVAQRVWI
jgi:hypothetical protein